MQTHIDPKQHVATGTGFHVFVGWSLFLILFPIIILLTIVGTYGLALIAWIIAGVLYSSRTRKARARLRGSAVLVNGAQFPWIHEAARGLAKRLGLAECPDIYVIEDNQQNAFALKHGSKRCVVLTDDIVYGALASGNTRALNFILAHELAHHALGHTHLLRRFISSKYLPLSRLDEFSCDAVAHALIGDTAAARDALILLLVGPQLFQRIDKEALDQQAHSVLADRHSKKSEAGLSHPLLLRRYAQLQETRTL
ncbi:MAG: M48 family metallopeptidase [Gammaproteobacteria bacterium]|nr:M48 family metallopeptidase [Betaproteobacteria bacterium]MBM4231746.1 M48 family metallopeptidase [Gammaproteobacteria bacterium]